MRSRRCVCQLGNKRSNGCVQSYVTGRAIERWCVLQSRRLFRCTVATNSCWRAAISAAEFDVGMHTHLAESKIQAIAGTQRYGNSLTAHLANLGLLGPAFVAAHGVWLDGEDMRRLGAHGCSIAHNPVSNMRLGNGIADAVAMLAAGVNLSIGTDAANCNDNLNM